jgi:hypothetical protein
LAVLTGFGCATRSVYDVPVQDAGMVAADDTSSTISSKGASIPVGQRPPVVVIVDDPHNLQLELLQVFSARLNRPYQIFNLSHRAPETVRVKLQALAPIQVIAMGSMAMEVADGIAGVEIVHSGVLDPASPESGVDPLPPFNLQLDHWLALSPRIERVGVIGGPRMHSRIEALQLACDTRGVALERREVESDKESLLAFRSMVPHIDGFVFLPDGSVLSPKVIEQMMGHGQRNEVQMLVYSPVMFALGATLLVEPDPVEVASALIDLLADPTTDPKVTGMRTRTQLVAPLATASLRVVADDG